MAQRLIDRSVGETMYFLATANQTRAATGGGYSVAVMRRYAAVAAICTVLNGCNSKPDPVGGEINEQLATADAFIDAFYSFDPRRLDALLGHAAKSKPAILYYQGWAEGGNYKIKDRKPCTPAGANSVACS